MSELKIWVAWVGYILTLVTASVVLYCNASPVLMQAGSNSKKDTSNRPTDDQATELPVVTIEAEAEVFSQGRRTIVVTATARLVKGQPLAVRTEWTGNATKDDYTVRDAPPGNVLEFKEDVDRLTFIIERRLDITPPAVEHELKVALVREPTCKIQGQEYISIKFPGARPKLLAKARPPKVLRGVTNAEAVIDVEISPPPPNGLHVRCEVTGDAVTDVDYKLPNAMELALSSGRATFRIPVLDFGPVGLNRKLYAQITAVGDAASIYEPQTVPIEIADDAPMKGRSLVIVLNTVNLGEKTIAALDSIVKSGDNPMIGGRPFLLARDRKLYRWHPEHRHNLGQFSGTSLADQRDAALFAINQDYFRKILGGNPSQIVLIWQNETKEAIPLSPTLGSPPADKNYSLLRLFWIGSPAAKNGDLLDAVADLFPARGILDMNRPEDEIEIRNEINQIIKK